MSSLVPSTPSSWPHRWAWLLACATFPLVWWGGLVTATGSGMAFKDWLTSDGVFMPLYPWLSSAGDKFIEHGHRLLGMASGMLTIALVASLYLTRSPRWVRWFGLVLLLGVVLQGVLGGVRVTLDEQSPESARVIALIHGCVGPLFFAATAAILAGREGDLNDADDSSEARRARMARLDAPLPAKLLRLAILTAGLAYLQLVVGAIVRHSPLMLSESAATVFRIAVYFHILLAIAVTVHVLLLAHRCFWRRISRGPSAALALLIGMQVLLGVSTWMLKYGVPEWATGLIGETGHFNRASGTASAVIVTAHGAVGSLIVALCVALALQVGRRVKFSSAVNPRLAHQAARAPA
jgi:heme a synthase